MTKVRYLHTHAYIDTHPCFSQWERCIRHYGIFYNIDWILTEFEHLAVPYMHMYLGIQVKNVLFNEQIFQ